MINIKHKEFFQKLIERTNEKSINWNEGTSTDSFSCNFTSGKIVVSKLNDDDRSANNVYVTLINNAGASSFIADEYQENGNNEDYKLLLDLYNVASNSFYKIDESIDKFTQELDAL